MSGVAIKRLSNRELIEKLRKRPKAQSGDGEARFFLTLFKEISAIFKEKINIDIEMAVADNDPKRAYKQKQSEGLFGARFKIEGADSPLGVGLERTTLEGFVAASCGAKNVEANATERAITQIDRKITHLILRTFADAIQKTTMSLTKRTITLVDEEGSLEEALELASTQPNKTFWFNIKSNNLIGRVAIFVSSQTLTLLHSSNDTLVVDEHTQDHSDWRERLECHRENIETILTATIEEDGLTIGDFDDLAIGSVLALKASPTSPISFSVQDVPLFNCNLGQEDGYYTLRILDGAQSAAKTLKRKAIA